MCCFGSSEKIWIMYRPTVTHAAVVLFLAYFGFVGNAIYALYTPKSVHSGDENGMGNVMKIGELADVYIYASSSGNACKLPLHECELIYSELGIRYDYNVSKMERLLDVKINDDMLKKNSVYLHTYMTKSGVDPLNGLLNYNSNHVFYTKEKISKMLPVLPRPKRLVDLSHTYDGFRPLEKELSLESSSEDKQNNASHSIFEPEAKEELIPPLRKSLMWVFAWIMGAYLTVNAELAYDKHVRKSSTVCGSIRSKYMALRLISFLFFISMTILSISAYSHNRKDYQVQLAIDKSEAEQLSKNSKLVMHLPSSSSLRIAVTSSIFPRNNLEVDMYYFISQNNFGVTAGNKEYKPFIMFNNYWNPSYSYGPVTINHRTRRTFKFMLHLHMNHLGTFRLMHQLSAQFNAVRDQMKLTDRDLDAVKDLFYKNSLYMLLSTFVISIFHLLFNFLAFKNEISYWRKRKSTIGVSVRAVMFSGISQSIVMLYLIESQSSMLIVVPKVIECVINHWKIKKALKIELLTSHYIIPIGLKSNELSDQEKDSEDSDIVATKYMMIALYPIMIAYGIYSILFLEHAGWFSWLLVTITGYIYAFGFIMMTPQLFINYKLKSVAHLPWDAMFYKAFTTFIDDIFAFIIYMPTMHRIACLRDDIVFFCFLYQKYIYQTDYTRINEFGFSGDDVIESEIKNSSLESKINSDAKKKD